MTEDAKVSDISENVIKDMLLHAVEKVFTTMMSLDITFKNAVTYPKADGQPPLTSPIPPDKPVIAGSVGFIGNVNGVMYIYLDEGLAKKLTGAFLGMDEQTVEQEGSETINDALGEITNMTVGTFKNQLCDVGYNCRLTIPSILRGQYFTVETTVASRIERTSYHFETMGMPCIVDLLMKKRD